jgi:hypothetical protein
MEEFEEKMRRGGEAAIEEVGRFFMGEDPVHRALKRIGSHLEALGVPYAVAGGMALVVHGYDRTTVDVDILITEAGLRRAHERLQGLGYTTPFSGSTQLRDAENGVRIEFLVTGRFPGDGKPKPVAFPDPQVSFVEIGGVRYLRIEKLIEIKLASGMTAPGRLKDLADVQELIRSLGLKADFAGRLDPYVREKFTELWRGVEGEG